MSDVKLMDIKEFREEGYLQEVNRQFFHPLGLALATNIDDDTGEETLHGIWDYREDPEGIYYSFDDPACEYTREAPEKAKKVQEARARMAITRVPLLGFEVEPIPLPVPDNFNWPPEVKDGS